MNPTTKNEYRPAVLPRFWNRRLKAKAAVATRRAMFEIKRRILKKLSHQIEKGRCLSA